MANKLRDIFSTTMNDYYRNLYQQLYEAETYERLHPPKFVEDEDSGHYHSDPFDAFYGDCEDCVYFMASPYDFVEGGNCTIDGHGCGWGITCKNHRFLESALYRAEWLENQLKKEDGEPL